MDAPEALGFRIYRTTCESEEQGSEFMVRFKAAVYVYKVWRPTHNSECSSRDTYAKDEELGAAIGVDAVASDGPKSEVHDKDLGKVYGPPNPSWSKYFGTSNPARSEKRPGDPQYFNSPRYRFFIEVDQECLERVLAIDDPNEYMTPFGGAPYVGWVNIVNSRWSLYPPITLEEAYRPHPNDPEIEFDNGYWFRATPAYLYPYLFAALTSDPSDTEYLRPPRVTDCRGGFAPEYGKAVQLCTSIVHAEFGPYGQDRCEGIWWTNDETCGENEEERQDAVEMGDA